MRRSSLENSKTGKKRGYSANHCFSQIVICGECGEMFRRLHWNNRGKKSIVWRCISRLETTGLECHARNVNEELLKDIAIQAINQMLVEKSKYKIQLQQNIAAVIKATNASPLDEIDSKLQKLQKDLIEKASNKDAYDEIANEIFRLRELREQTTIDTVARDEQINRINEIQDFINKQELVLTFDETLVSRWIKQILVYENYFTAELKSGLSINIEG